MFLKNSRYFGQPSHSVPDGAGGQATLLVPRNLPATLGTPATVAAHDQLDALADSRLRDATRYWHIADANTALRAGDLVAEPGSEIILPDS